MSSPNVETQSKLKTDENSPPPIQEVTKQKDPRRVAVNSLSVENER